MLLEEKEQADVFQLLLFLAKRKTRRKTMSWLYFC